MTTATDKAAAKLKKAKLTAVWKATHNDFKGRSADGVRCILLLRPGLGTCSVPLDGLTDAEIADRLPKNFQPPA